MGSGSVVDLTVQNHLPMEKEVSMETGKLDAVSTLTGDDLCMTKEQHKEDDEHKLKNEKPCLNNIGMLDGDNEMEQCC